MPEKMKRAIASVVTVALVGIVVWGLVIGEPSEHDRVQALGSRIRCPVCHGESIADSPSTYARDILTFVEEKVGKGWTDEEIVSYLEHRFAGIRLDPAFSGTTILLWLLPIAALAGGVTLAVRRTKRSDGTK